MNVAVLCGGKGTRANTPINKCFIEIAGKPFILHLLEQLEEYGFNNVVLCRGDQGRLEALKSARKQLGERFLVLYGDTYTPLDFTDFIDKWNYSALPAISAEYKGIDAGINGYATYILDHANSLDALKARLNKRDLIYHYGVTDAWHEVGTPKAQAEAEEWFTKREIKNYPATTTMAWRMPGPTSNILTSSSPEELSLNMMTQSVD